MCVCSCIACWACSPMKPIVNLILTPLVIALIPPPQQRTAHCGLCLSLPSTRCVGANVGWHSDTLADVFWHCEDPSCAFTYAMTQISIPPHTPSTLIRAAQLKQRLSSMSLWPRQPWLWLWMELHNSYMKEFIPQYSIIRSIWKRYMEKGRWSMLDKKCVQIGVEAGNWEFQNVSKHGEIKPQLSSWLFSTQSMWGNILCNLGELTI